MTQPENSRIDELDEEIFHRILVQGHSLLIGDELVEIQEAAPALSRPEIAQLGTRLRHDGCLDATEANKALASLAIVARIHEDQYTVKNIRNHFLKRFNLIGAGLVLLEERKLVPIPEPR